jgi:hypothetical protein
MVDPRSRVNSVPRTLLSPQHSRRPVQCELGSQLYDALVPLSLRSNDINNCLSSCMIHETPMLQPCVLPGGVNEDFIEAFALGRGERGDAMAANSNSLCRFFFLNLYSAACTILAQRRSRRWLRTMKDYCI